jgi:hypothetical protein
MPSGQNSAIFQHIRKLFNVGAIGGLSDRQLLERWSRGAAKAPSSPSQP